MSKHFQILDFLRRAPKDLLQEYFARLGALGGFDWGPGKRVQAEKVAAAMQALGSNVFNRVAIDFRAIWDLAGPTFTHGVLNEAKHHQDDDAYATVSGFKSHLAKAFWVTLNRPSLIANARILSDVEKLPQGAWIKRGPLPARAGPQDQSHVELLQDAVVDFFSRTQHRGFNCKIDCLRREDEDIFFAYAEDYPDTDLFWHDGELTPQVLNPSFNLIFKHNDRLQTLEIYMEGDRSIVPDLQQLFARTVIGDEIPRDAPDSEEIYRLERLLEPGFKFEHSDDLGIADVRITKMRFQIQGEPWRRFTAEANTKKLREALKDFVESLTPKLPKSRLFLDQVCINVMFHKRTGDRKAPSRTFYITHPNSIRLKKDDLGEKIAEMLFQSGIEIRTDGSSDEIPATQGA